MLGTYGALKEVYQRKIFVKLFLALAYQISIQTPKTAHHNASPYHWYIPYRYIYLHYKLILEKVKSDSHTFMKILLDTLFYIPLSEGTLKYFPITISPKK